MEIERKFLATIQPWMSDPSFIEQGYLSTGDVEVRLRRTANHLSLTVKTGEGLVRGEVEVQLSEDQFSSLWPLTEGVRVCKRRYSILSDGLPTIFVDEFLGELSGLVMAEVEFSSEPEASAYVAPRWFGPEVTGVKSYSNKRLARMGLVDNA
jgi:adenylate cyclase